MNIRISLALVVTTLNLAAGHPSFTFHQIAGDTTTMSVIERDAAGNIININDGKKTPLMLSSIPYKEEHFAALKTTVNGSNTPRALCLITLTETWENKKAGLYALVKNNANIIQCHYPTQDGQPLTFIDILCAVHDLEQRDSRNCAVYLVHCRYGKGRSALAVAAYIAHVLYKNGINPDPDKIELYLISRRSQVRLHNGQRKALASFCAALIKAGSFENLCHQYHKDMRRKCCSK